MARTKSPACPTVAPPSAHRTRAVLVAALVFALAALTGCASPGVAPPPPANPQPTASESRSEVEPAPVVAPAAEADADVPVSDIEPDIELDPAPEATAPEPVAPIEAEPAQVPQPSMTEPDEARVESTTEAPAESAPEPTIAPVAEVIEPAPAAQRSIRGQIMLQGGQAEVSETVVYFVPRDGANAPAPGVYDIETRDKTFAPIVTVVPRGSEIRFPNRDPILHNVFSVSGDNAFDLGVYGPDTAPGTTLEQTGAVNVYCNVHHDMHAHVLVLDTPWYVQVGTDGRFALDGLPPGPGTLTVWHRQAEAWSMAVDDSATAPIEVNLDIVRPQLPEHMDKTGQSYFRRDRDPYR